MRAPIVPLLVCALLGPASRAADPPARCTLVVGQGRYAADEEAADAGWDRINRTLATQVATDIAALGERTLLLTLPVTFDDVPRVVATVLENARREGCDRVVETSLFSTPGGASIVARLRAYPVSPEGTSIGDPAHVTQFEYPDTLRNRDRLQPSALGHDLAADYLRAAAASPKR